MTIKPVRIDRNGEVSLFFFSAPVEIGGLTPGEAERRIVDALDAAAPLTSAGPVYIRRLETAARGASARANREFRPCTDRDV